MRKIKIEIWKIKDTVNELNWSLLKAINVLLNSKKADDVPRGLDKFRLYNRIGKAFDKAEKTGELVLEETDYSYLKTTLESDLPASWALEPKLYDEVEKFLAAERVDPQ